MMAGSIDFAEPCGGLAERALTLTTLKIRSGRTEEKRIPALLF
jgi:hypothetical protein